MVVVMSFMVMHVFMIVMVFTVRRGIAASCHTHKVHGSYGTVENVAVHILRRKLFFSFDRNVNLPLEAVKKLCIGHPECRPDVRYQGKKIMCGKSAGEYYKMLMPRIMQYSPPNSAIV